MEGDKSPTYIAQGVFSMTIPTVNFLSYNSTGISSDKCDFVNKLCYENDIKFVSLQEHFKNNKVTDKYCLALSNQFEPFGIPGYTV